MTLGTQLWNRHGVAALSAAMLLLVLLAACGGGDDVTPAATAVPPTSAPTFTPAPAPEPTATAIPPTPAPATAPTAAPEPTPAPQPTVTAVTPTPAPATAPTAAPGPTPAPELTVTAVPPTPAPATAPTAVPGPTPAPQPTATATKAEPCEGNRGGEIGDCAPELAGTQEWINSQPLTMEGLLGKVVLIDFWTYTCINCIRTVPFLQTWHERYADEGLVIIGVHTPEFEFEKLYQNVVDASEEMGVAWPVVQDNDFAVWSSYSNRYWPAKYLVDKDGVVQYRHFGEGKYAETEQEIRKLLREAGMASDVESMPLPEDQQRDEAYLQATRRATPELFAGWRFTAEQGRGGIGQVETYLPAAQASYDAGAQRGVVAEFEQPTALRPDLIYFHGPWAIGPESAVHARETADFEDSIVLVYSARSVNAVLTSDTGEPYKVVVTVNNEYLTEENRGEDVTIDEDGQSYVLVSAPKAYRLVEHDEWMEYQALALSSLSNDFGLFSFTFGTYEDGF